MDALISIKPEFVRLIITGEKKYEYRKNIFKKEIQRVFVYSSSPEMRIVGYFDWKGVITGNSNEVWKITSDYAGIDANRYQKYFHDNKRAYALKIEKFIVFGKPINPWNYEGFNPPQSYCYTPNLKEELYEKLCSMV